MYRELINAIANDRLSGASDLAARGAAALALLASECRASTADDFLAELLTAARALRRAQPAMAPLLHVAQRVLHAAQSQRDVEAMREVVRRAAETFQAELEAGGERIAQTGAGLLRDGAVVVTVSYSSLVLRALLRARREDKRLHVICAESRPLYEGRGLAQRLAEAGVEVTLTVDAAAPAQVARADVVLVGADGVTAEAVINKVGTYPLALAAQAHRVPLYALAGEEKFWPSAVAPLIPERDSAEVWPEPAAGVTIVNRYFEPVPLDLFTGLVTAAGILAPEQVRQQVSALRVHTALLEL